MTSMNSETTVTITTTNPVKTVHNYYMFSDEGNAACDEAIMPVVSVARALMPMLEDAYKKVAVNHPEVYDTEPRNEMHLLVINALRETGIIF